MSLPEIRVPESCPGCRRAGRAGSSTSEKSGRMSMCPKSPRERPPSLASAPTIWRGSTLWRLPTAIRYDAISTSVRPRGRRSGFSPPPRSGRCSRVSKDRCAGSGAGVEQQRLVAVHDRGQGGGDVGLGHVVLVDVVGDHVAEEVELVARRAPAVIASSKRESRVALMSSIVGICIWVSGWRVAFSMALEQVPLARGDEGDRVALAAGPAGAADAVDVGLGVGRDVVVDDVADPLDVETAGGDVGGDEDVELARLELVDRALALHLRHVAVDGHRGEATGPQLLGEQLGLVLGADEDDHPLEVLDLEDAGEGVDLLRVGADEVALGGVGRGRRLVLDRDLDRVVRGTSSRSGGSGRAWSRRTARRACPRGCRRGSSRRPRRSPS